MDKKRGKNKKTDNIAGKLTMLAQLLFSAVLFAVIQKSGMLPGKYMFLLSLFLLLLLIFSFGLQARKGKLRAVGAVLSVAVCIVAAFAAFEVSKVNKFLDTVSGVKYKVDDMVVAVRKDDPAQSITDAADYVFGIQTLAGANDTELMRGKIEEETGKEPFVKEYLTPQEAAEALLEGGEVGAIIYNTAFTPLIEEAVKGYSGKVRVLYRYEIKKAVDVNIEQKYENVIKKKGEKKSYNIYVSGIDTDGPVSVTSRSDVNIIITVNPRTRQILLTTTPRDYYVPIPEISGGAPDKLTHAGIYGPDASMRALQELYGIDFSYYARVNFTSLINIVDVLGGIEVYSEYSFSAGDYYFEEGMNYMDGEMALAFSRERHSFGSGDNQRGKNQEAVLTAIINKALSPAILNKAGQILEAVSDCVETNMTRDEMSVFINEQLEDGGSWGIEPQAVSGLEGELRECFSSGSQLLWVMPPDEESVAAVSARIHEVMDGQEEGQE